MVGAASRFRLSPLVTPQESGYEALLSACAFTVVTPVVSVVIPYYNRGDLVREAINSIRERPKFDLEIIVVDDGCDDPNELDDVTRSVERVLKVVRIDHGGASKARNEGVDNACGRYIKFLDADDVLAAGILETQTNVLEATGMDVCYSDWRFIGALRDGRTGGRSVRNMGPMDDPLDSLLNDWWCASFAYMFRRDAIRDIRWDERLSAGQDLDFIVKTAEHGAQFVYKEAMAGGYRLGSSGQITNNRTDAPEQSRSRIAVLEGVVGRLTETGRLTPTRRLGIAEHLYGLARIINATDHLEFTRLSRIIYDLNPEFVPRDATGLQKMAVRVLGIRGAEMLLSARRKLKAAVLGRE